MEECDVIYFFVQVRIVMPLPTLVVLPLVLVVRDVGQLLRLPRPLRSQMEKGQERNDWDPEGLAALEVDVDEGVELEGVEVEGVEVKGVEVEDMVVKEVPVDQGVIKAEDEVEEALVGEGEGEGEDMEDAKLQADKTSMLLIEPLLFIDVILVLCVCSVHLM